jgi:hypothetical protein
MKVKELVGFRKWWRDKQTLREWYWLCLHAIHKALFHRRYMMTRDQFYKAANQILRITAAVGCAGGAVDLATELPNHPFFNNALSRGHIDGADCLLGAVAVAGMGLHFVGKFVQTLRR